MSTFLSLIVERYIVACQTHPAWSHGLHGNHLFLAHHPLYITPPKDSPPHLVTIKIICSQPLLPEGKP